MSSRLHSVTGAGAPGSRRPVWVAVPTVIFIAALATLLQSYAAVKASLLALFVVVAVVAVAARRVRVIIPVRLVMFYALVSAAGLLWAFIGLLETGNYDAGNIDALRLYVMWSAVFVVLYTLMRQGPSLRLIHAALVLAGIIIPVVNLVGIYDSVAGLGLIPDDIRTELDMEIGIHEGYVQLTSQNVGAMFLIAPYLVARRFRSGRERITGLELAALLMSLALVAFSGRRALWLVVALTPFVIYAIGVLTRQHRLMSTAAHKMLLATGAVTIVGLSAVATQSAMDSGAAQRFRQAFSMEDERTIQAPYLLDAFARSPFLGAGFGGYAGYQRSDNRPWTYELTYHRLLFNTGLIGAAFLVALYAVYLWFVIQLLRRFEHGSSIPFSLLVGLICLFLGAYSNPYFGSFDYLFFVGLLPYLSTYVRGFDLEESPFARKLSEGG